jgi:hypothetical protein
MAGTSQLDPEKVSLANPADPSPNVLDIVRAESKYQDGMREAMGKLNEFSLAAQAQFSTFARDSESRMQTWMRDAETKRVDQLTAQSQNYEARIANMLADAVKDKSDLVATQLLQIQSSFGERVSKLEEFRLLSTGRAQVADPQIAASFDMINKNLSTTQDQFAKSLTDISSKMEVMAKAIIALQETSTKGGGREIGRHEVIAWGIAGAGFIASIISVVALFSHLSSIAAHIGG